MGHVWHHQERYTTTYIYIYPYMCICICICMYIYIYVYICYIHTYIYIYMYIYIDVFSQIYICYKSVEYINTISQLRSTGLVFWVRVRGGELSVNPREAGGACMASSGAISPLQRLAGLVFWICV